MPQAVIEIRLISAKIEFRLLGHADGAACDIDVFRKRPTYHLGLLMDFFEHEVAVLTLMDNDGRRSDFRRQTLHGFAVGVQGTNSFPRNECDVAVFQVADHVC